jgi:hypothetical protein
MRRLALSLVIVLSVAGGALVVDRTATAPAYAAKKKVNKKKARKKLQKSLRQGGLAKLPGVAAAVARNDAPAGLAAAVSGTPPALVDIAGLSVKDVFWRSGVLDRIAAGTPEPSDCGEFVWGSADGQSGGIGACYMAESVGRSMAALLEGETALCMMKSFPTAENVAAGAVTVVSGELPDDDITKLFVPPTGKFSRIVQVRVTRPGVGEQIVSMRIMATRENKTAGDLFAADIWFCRDAASPATGYNRVTLDKNGAFEADSVQQNGEGLHANHVVGFMVGDGLGVAWDRTRPRTATSTMTSTGGGGFKGEVRIGEDNLIEARSWRSAGPDTQKVFSVAEFSGTSAFDMRFLTGALRDGGSHDSGNTGATEYRDTLYVSAPESPLLPSAEAVDLLTDPFFTTPPTLTLDTSAFSCAETPDVVLAMDLANSALQAAVATCQPTAFQSVRFCENDEDVAAARQNFASACAH